MWLVLITKKMVGSFTKTHEHCNNEIKMEYQIFDNKNYVMYCTWNDALCLCHTSSQTK